MRLLVLSDIHGNKSCVEELHRREGDGYDAVLIAGDIEDPASKGAAPAGDILGVLDSFACPVLYVLGNRDRRVAHGERLSANALHLHQRVLSLGGYHFSGFSGCLEQWGQDPLAARIMADARGAGPAERKAASKAVLQAQAARLGAMVRDADIDPGRLTIMTHARVFRLSERLGLTPLLHVFGHRHAFQASRSSGAWLVNPGPLDTADTLRRPTHDAGSYAVVTLKGNEVRIDRKRLAPEGGQSSRA